MRSSLRDAHRKKQIEEKLAFEGYADHDLVFGRESRTPLNPEAVSLVFRRRVAASGVRQIRFHDLRHSWASLALRAGQHPKVVSEILGHSKISITLDTYSHVIPAMLGDATDKVAALIRGPERSRLFRSETNFQSAAPQGLRSAGPTSGTHLVGPLFRLWAVAQAPS